MAWLGIRYDLLTRESDILQYRLWETAFASLKEGGSVVLETEGKNAGCWLMRLSESPEFAGLEDADKVIVRSDGTVTYVGKDIAYQMWKFGLLSADFRYEHRKPFPWEKGAQGDPWETTSGPGEPDAPRFGRANRVYNVIDVRQAYLQKIVKEALRLLGHPEAADRSVHFSYEMVALSRKAAEALGMPADASGSGPVGMSGRKGLGVKADDLLVLVEIGL